MREGFRTLADALFEPPVQQSTMQPPSKPDDEITRSEIDAAREIRLFHARIAEAVDAGVERVLCDVACDVLARELRIAPADIAAITERALQRYATDAPVRVRLHPNDAASVKCAVPVISDGGLMPGDAILELQDGFVDAGLGVRLEAALRGLRQ